MKMELSFSWRNHSGFASRAAGWIAAGIFALVSLAPLPVRAQDSAAVAEKPEAASFSAEQEGEGALPFLWRVKNDPPSYLFGTVHIGNPRVLAKIDEVDWAIADTDALYTELKMDMSTQMDGFTLMVLPAGKTLEDMLPRKVYKRLMKYVDAKKESTTGQAAMLLESVAAMKPWAVAMQLGMLEIIDEMANGALDMHLYQIAAKLGKDVDGLETLMEQIGVFDDLAPAEQVLMLEGTLEMLESGEFDMKAFFKEMLDKYVAGDEEGLLELLAQENSIGMGDDPAYKALNEKVEKRLLFDRNKHMADRMAAFMRDSPKKGFFFAVGLAHYPGEGGVIELLEAKGFEIERVAREELDLRNKDDDPSESYAGKLAEPAGPPPKGSLAERMLKKKG